MYLPQLGHDAMLKRFYGNYADFTSALAFLYVPSFVPLYESGLISYCLTPPPKF